MTNPLLENHPLPPFTKIKPEHVEPAIKELIAENLTSIEALLDKATQPTWESLILPIENLEDKLNQAWSPVSHLNSVANTPALRAAYHACLPLLTDYSTKIGQNKRLYEAHVAIQNSPEFSKLSQAQQKVIKDAIRDFKLSGVALDEDKRKEYASLSRQLSEMQSKFQDNVMDATDAWHLDIAEETALRGVPAHTIAIAQRNAQKADMPGFRLTLDYPCFEAVMTYAEDSKLRQKMHEAYSTRASNIGPHDKKFDNSELMDQIAAVRHRLALLLGFNNYAEESLATKMASTPESVLTFLHTLAEKALPFAKRDFNELKGFAKEMYGVMNLQPWDVAFFSEKMKQKYYAISQEEIRAYFPVDRALAGMFEVVKRLFGMEIKERTSVEKWHDTVRFFEIFDKENKLRGQFYLDLFARPHKRGGAWMDDARSRRVVNNTLQTPIAYLTCNFQAKTKDEPSILTHEEVITLFHEFGHGLHHMLTQVDYLDVSGINGVPWDAVEFPSQFLENWCWQDEALKFISGHFQTNEPLPAPMLEKIKQAKNFQSGMRLMRQIEFALFDFRFHHEYDPKKGGRFQEILDEIRARYSVVPIASYNRFAHSFNHIFAGGYAAGYYSYLWAEVLSQDAFSKFEHDGIFNAQTGQAFLTKILEKGGSVEPEILFTDFRGRKPEITALLKHYGLVLNQ